VIVGLLVGTGVTVVSAIGPARHAVRIAPVAALTDRTREIGRSCPRRSAGVVRAEAGPLAGVTTRSAPSARQVARGTPRSVITATSAEVRPAGV
jgi:hypothetical protein